MKEFKIRCSAIGQIMTNPRSKTDLLSQTTITYCEDWLKDQIYDRRKVIESKYMDKGTIMEGEAIEFVSAYFPDLPLLIKNEKNFESDFMTGTPDLILSDSVIDIKCPWDAYTFPLFENELPEKNYYWQLQGYMNLTGISKGQIIYVLMDTPLEMIEKEIRFKPDKEDEIIKYHSYGNIPDKYRIKCFEVLRNDQDIEAIKQRVKDCRNYINSIKI